MKKSLKYLCLSLILPLSICFAGCNNENRTLAKNLDNTVTNLIYSISSLDSPDKTVLGMLSQTDYDNSLNYGFTDGDNGDNNSENPTINNEGGTKNNYPDFHHNHHHHGHHHHHEGYYQNQNSQENQNGNTTNPEVNAENYQYMRNYRVPVNQNGGAFMPQMYRQNPYYNQGQNIYPNYKKNNYQARTLQNNSAINNMNVLDSQNGLSRNEETPKVRLVNFSTESITSNTSKVGEKITELISLRSNLLIYINDLYKGNINLSKEDKNALNAYMNIIKDNTSYLNQNRGIITNELSHASDLHTSSPTSSLINAYIIRTNEAIMSRIVKLESSISAMSSIVDIMKGSVNNNSPSYVSDKYFNQNKNNDTNININPSPLNNQTQINRQPNINNTNLGENQQGQNKTETIKTPNISNVSPINNTPLNKNQFAEAEDENNNQVQKSDDAPDPYFPSLGIEKSKNTLSEQTLNEPKVQSETENKNIENKECPDCDKNDKEENLIKKSNEMKLKENTEDSNTSETVNIIKSEKLDDKKTKKIENTVNEKARENLKELTDKALGKEVKPKENESNETKETEEEFIEENNNIEEVSCFSFLENKTKKKDKTLMTISSQPENRDYHKSLQNNIKF